MTIHRTKQMKGRGLALAAWLAAVTALLTTGCSNYDDPVAGGQPAQGGTYTMAISASRSDAATTRALTSSGSTLTATWGTSDKIYVQKGSTWSTTVLKPDAAKSTAMLKGTLSGITVNAGDNLTLQFPKSGAPTYTGQKGTLTDIAANFDYAKATVKVKGISSTNNIIPEATTTTFSNQQAIVKFTLQNSSGAVIKATSLKISAPGLKTSGSATGDITITPTSATSEIYAALSGIASATTTLTATVGSDTYKSTKSGVTFANGKYYTIGVKMSKAIPEQSFSVSANKYVKFAPGNLQAVFTSAGTSCTWKFADKPWDYVGEAAANTSINGSGSVSKAGTVDLFGWVGASASVDNYGIDKTNDNAHYSNKLGESLKHDWGTLNITNGGSYTWFTPTSDEWKYVFETRTTESNIKYAKATVAGKAGVILLPDDWSASYYTLADTNTPKAKFDTNTITEAEWNSNFATHGAVFLPATGFLSPGDDDYEIRSVGTDASYWSSTSYYSVGFAYVVNFNNSILRPQYQASCRYGNPVRLARVVE